MTAPTILIAAPASGTGKTLLTMGIARALRRRGLRVGAFKVGPDYIDPQFLGAATGRRTVNLDGWAMRLETLVGLAGAAASEADIVLGEGVMGLFDGAAGGAGSTAELAALFDLPVLLVVDASGMGASVAALVEGFARFQENVEIAGIILNRVAGLNHARLLIEACDDRFATPILGWLAREPQLELPRRHLGLIQAQEHPQLDAFIDTTADRAARQLDLDRLMRLARLPSISSMLSPAYPIPPLGQRIAVARDAAFGFAYLAVLDGWRRAGAELATFQPLADEAPAEDCDAVYLPGGYPELHAARLAANLGFLGGLCRAAGRGATVYGECGGYMVLGEALIDGQGHGHRLAGLLPVTTSFADPALQLGYRRIVTAGDTPLGATGSRFRGHEFHYARETRAGGAPLFRAADSRGRELGSQGCLVGTVAGSFLHLVDREA